MSTCKPRPISGNLPVDAIPKDYNRYCDRIVGNGGTIFLQPETIAFVERVIADGGTVEDVVFLNRFILDAKSNGYFGDIVAAYSPSWGVKGGATASDLYSITGVATDLSQTLGASQPTINIADLNGKTRLFLDGIDDKFNRKSFTFSQPETIILGGFEQEAWSNTMYAFDGFNSNSMALLQSGITPDLYLSAGTLVKGTSAATIGAPFHIRSLFNSTASAIQVDNTAEVVVDAGASAGNGFTLGARGGIAGLGFINMSIGLVVLLDAAIDANYPAKMAALYNFSKNAYGTA